MHDADIELLASQIAYKELERRQTKELNEKTDAIVKKNEAIQSLCLYFLTHLLIWPLLTLSPFTQLQLRSLNMSFSFNLTCPND